MLDEYKESMQRLNIFIDCGIKDEFRLYEGARIFTSKLTNMEIKYAYED